MKAVELVGLFAKKQVGPRCELMYGQEVVTGFDLAQKWRVEQQEGKVEYFDAKPRYPAGKDASWPKIEQVTVVCLKLGAPKQSLDER